MLKHTMYTLVLYSYISTDATDVFSVREVKQIFLTLFVPMPHTTLHPDAPITGLQLEHINNLELSRSRKDTTYNE